ncbi:MAG: amino acid ABC transporter substrate-binding protein [Candidatus Methylomirabilales bacterium]
MAGSKTGGGAERSLTRRAFMRLLAGAALVPLAPAPRARAARRRPLKVGASLNLTGDFNDEGIRQGLAYRLWAEEVNAGGGLLGRPVELILYDDGFSPDRAAAHYARLIREDRVDLLLGPFGSIPSAGAVPVIEASRIPCVMPMAANPRIWTPGRHWCVQLIPPAPTFMNGVVTLLQQARVRRLAIIHVDALMALDVATGFRDKARQAGIAVIFFAQYAHGAGEISSVKRLYRQIRDLRPDAVGHIRSAHDMGEILHAAGEMALRPRLWAWMQMDEAEWLEVEPEACEGMVGSAFWTPEMPFPGSQAFVRSFLERWRHGYPAWQEGGLLDHHGPAGYAACQLTQQAVEAVGRLDAAAMRDWLFAVRTETVFGGYGIDHSGAQVRKRSPVLQWQDGKRVVVWPSEYRTATLRVPAPVGGPK